MASGLNLFVAQLPTAVDDEILRIAFSEYGELFTAQVAKDDRGVSKNYGFVHFCSVNDGLRAKEELDGTVFFGRTIYIKIAHKQEGRCYNVGGKRSMWEDDWNRKSSSEAHEAGSVSDLLSQCSFATRNESNKVETPDIRERMRNLFESQTFTDVTFYPKNNRKQSISAHRAILAVGSPLFKKMLFDDESKVAVGEKLEVQISNLSFDAFTCIVKYLYTDEIYFESDTLVQDILDAAKEFSIHSLVVKCNEYFENEELTSDNVCSKLQMSLSNKITSLKERCIEFIQQNTLSVIKSSDFQHCESTTMRAICKLQSLNLRSELELLEAVMQWLHVQPHHERKNHLQSLLKCIRFLNLTVGELGYAIKKYPMMTADEGLSIIVFLSDVSKNSNFSSLPSWCNKNTTSRCFFKEEDPPTPRVSQTDQNVYKVLLPLKSDPRQGFVAELTSLLQMKCISGSHEIKAIKLIFQKPMSDRWCINNLSINVHVSPSAFKVSEKVQIGNSESVRVEFRKIIKVRRGDTLDIEAVAKDIKLYKFLQFDDSDHRLDNPHFSICISSMPKQGKLYFISEIEYGPQNSRYNNNAKWNGRNTRK